VGRPFSTSKYQSNGSQKSFAQPAYTNGSDATARQLLRSCEAEILRRNKFRTAPNVAR